MTNLTDLLPAGAGGKQVSFTASGAISSGQTVGLNSDGTVSVIDSSTGDVATFTSNRQTYTTAVYDATNDRIVVFYRDQGDSDKGKAIVGTVSGTSISFGTAVQFEAGLTNSIDAVFDPDSGKILVSYEDDTNSSYGTAIVGTVSGTSISFGTAVVFASVNTTTTSITYDTNLDRVAIAFAPFVSYRRGEGIAGQVSGTSITFGSSVQFDTDNTGNTSIDLVSIVFDSTNNKVVIIYTGASQKIQGVVGTISGTSISFGTPADVSAVTDYRQPKAVFDSNAGKVFAIFRDNSDSYIKGAVGTISGTSMSFGTTATLSSITATNYPSAVYDPDNQNIKAIFKQSASPNSTYVFTATISGTSVSASGEKVLYAAGAEAQQNSMTYDTSSNQVISAVRVNTTDIGVAFVHKSGSGVPNTEFIGIADAAISDTASGNITIKGGVASNTDISTPLVVTVNTASTFLTSTPARYAQAYDPDNNKALIIGRSGNIPHSYVATVSGTSISYGSVVYPAGVINANFRNQSLTYDTNANKFVFCYQDNNNSSYGTAVVGTLSGTSTTWGTPVVYASVNAAFNEVVYDSNAQKVAVFYKNQSASNQGVAIVGTVSGTSISFGSSTDFLASNTNDFALAYDTNAQKIFVAVTDYGASLGRAYVATISGTSISFGTPTTFLSGVVAGNSLAAAYDSTNQKCILAYTDDGPDEGYMVVGTISGTSVSFGSTTQYGVSSSQKPNMACMAYDATNQLINVIYNESGVGVRTTYASVSGTSVTIESDTQVIASTSVEDNGNLYDPDNGNIIAVYTDYANTDGVSSVVTTSSTLVPNSTYYVQSDGTLSTTSSSVTAGKALSATSINLDYSS